MKIRVDRPRCQGHAQCWVVDEKLFPLDELGYSIADGTPVAPDEVVAAQSGVAICPERAIWLDE
ncbi:ferredoxin [Mycobacterium sp. CBMA226]|nr:ferredoxin [Mycolicibacterium sp. CBMA 226]